MRSIPDELAAAREAGDYHAYLAAKIDQLSLLHSAGQKADPKHYKGHEIVAQIEMLKACDLAMWQMKEALGYPIPNAVDTKYPRALAGNCGNNPFKCGVCDGRAKYPDAHLRVDAERHGGMYVPPKDFIKT